MLNPTQNSWILTVEPDNDFTMLSNQQYIKELGLKARMRYESEPIFQSMHTIAWWIAHFKRLRKAELLTLCETLGLEESKKSSCSGLRLDLATYFHCLIGGHNETRSFN